MNNFNKGVAVAIGIAIFSTVQAQVATTDCTGCSIGQIEALAPLCAQGYSYITDFAAPKLYKLCFTIDVNDAYRPPKKEKDYYWAQPESWAMQLFQAYENVYLDNGHIKAAAAHVRVYIPAPFPQGDNGYMNAYDVVSSSANMTALSGYLSTGSITRTYIEGQPDTAAAAHIADLLNAISLNGIIKIDGFPVSFIMDFDDGSHVTVQYNATTGYWGAVPGTARDANGNVLPESQSMAGNNGQSYGFDGRNSYDFGNFESRLRNLQAQGIPVTNGSGGGSVHCTWDGHTLACSIKQF